MLEHFPPFGSISISTSIIKYIIVHSYDCCCCCCCMTAADQQVLLNVTCLSTVNFIDDEIVVFLFCRETYDQLPVVNDGG